MSARIKLLGSNNATPVCKSAIPIAANSIAGMMSILAPLCTGVLIRIIVIPAIR